MGGDEKALLVAEGLGKVYPTPAGPLPILEDVSLSLAAGASLAIMGPSGAGKSTLLNILGTLDHPTSGTVHIAGADPFALSEPELAAFRNRRIGFVFQDHHLLPQCSVLENVLFPTLASKGGATAELAERAEMLLEQVGLTGRLDHRPAMLSGGEKQRVAIARALINRPELLLCDEPTGNLDGATAKTLGDLLVEGIDREDRTTVVVTHSLALAERFDQTRRLEQGTLR